MVWKGNSSAGIPPWRGWQRSREEQGQEGTGMRRWEGSRWEMSALGCRECTPQPHGGLFVVQPHSKSDDEGNYPQ